MCLVVPKDRKFKVAEKDITVYKVLKRSKISDTQTYWLTPYRSSYVGARINKNTRLKADGFVVKIPYDVANAYLIEDGVIHAFTKEDVCYCSVPFGKMFIFECVIPKGTEYVMGDFNEIGAKEIRFVRRLKQIK